MIFMKPKESCVEILHGEQQQKNSDTAKNIRSDPARQRRCKEQNRKIYDF